MKIKGGYILKARKTLESDLMDKPPLWSKLWDWMLLRAEWREGKKLKRGQFHTSIEEMREAMSWKVGYRKITPSVKEIRKAYEGFAKGTMVGITRGTRGMVITILNYNEYQDPKNYEGHDEGHDEGSTKGTPRAHDSKEVEEVKNEKRTLSPEVLPAPPSESPRRDSLAERLPALADFVSRFHADRRAQHPTLLTRDLTGPQLEKCIRVLDQLSRLDHHDLEATIKPALRWAARDDFWSRNVLSIAGLRDKSKNGLSKFQNILAAHKRFQEEENPLASWQPIQREARQ